MRYGGLSGMKRDLGSVDLSRRRHAVPVIPRSPVAKNGYWRTLELTARARG